MVLKDILSISGEPGLFRFIAQGKNAIIIEHIETGRRSSAYSSAKVSSLEDISVFTESEDLPLAVVFDKLYEKESGGQSIDSKSDPDKLKKYFEEILPDYSREKVYISDIKKIFQWYNLLQKQGLLVKEKPEDKKEDKSSVEPEAVNNTPAEKKKKKELPDQKSKKQPK